MPVIDTRLITIQDLQKKYSEVCQSNPALAVEIHRKAMILQQELHQDMEPLNKLLGPWKIYS